MCSSFRFTEAIRFSASNSLLGIPLQRFVNCGSIELFNLGNKNIQDWRGNTFAHYNWALDARKIAFGVCDQHWCRPACASAQTDQPICYSIFGNNHI